MGVTKCGAIPVGSVIAVAARALLFLRLANIASLREPGICDLFFVPPEVMSEFVEVGYSNFAEKDGSRVMCCSGQSIEKEGDARHLVGLIRRPVQQ